MRDDTTTEEESIDVHVTMPHSLAERLAEHYPAALSLPEGIRMAVDDAVEAREQEITREDITEATIDALEQADIEVGAFDETD